MTTYLAQANTGSDTLASTKTVTKPATVSSGAVGVFWLVRWHESGSFPTVTAPVGAVLRGTITTASMQTQCYLHRVADETSFAYSWTSGRWSTLAAVWFGGVDPTIDLATVPFQSATGSGTAIGALTVTSDIDSALAWHVNTIDTSGVTHTPPTGFTEVTDVSPWASAYRIAVASGSQTADGAAASPTTAWAAGLVALPPAPTGGTTGAATLASTAALDAAGARRTTGGTSLTAAAPRTATGTRGASTTSALAAGVVLAAEGLVSSHATSSATLTTTADIEAAGQTAVIDGALLDALALLTGDGQRTAATNGSIDTTADLAADGLASRSSQASLDAAAGLDAVGRRSALAGAGLASQAALTADGLLGTPPVVGTGALTATAALSAAGTVAAVSGAGLTTTTTLTAAGTTSGSSDDIEITVGAPYIRWTAGQPQSSLWAVQAPRAGEWKAGAPW